MNVFALVFAKDCTGKEKQGLFFFRWVKCENMVDPLGIYNVTPHLNVEVERRWGGGWTSILQGIQVASDSLLLIGGRLTYEIREVESDVFCDGTLSRRNTFGFAFFMLLEVRAWDRKAYFPMSQWKIEMTVDL